MEYTKTQADHSLHYPIIVHIVFGTILLWVYCSNISCQTFPYEDVYVRLLTLAGIILTIDTINILCMVIKTLVNIIYKD